MIDCSRQSELPFQISPREQSSACNRRAEFLLPFFNNPTSEFQQTYLNCSVALRKPTVADAVPGLLMANRIW
jgi:hypothetical protein